MLFFFSGRKPISTFLYCCQQFKIKRVYECLACVYLRFLRHYTVSAHLKVKGIKFGSFKIVYVLKTLSLWMTQKNRLSNSAAILVPCSVEKHVYVYKVMREFLQKTISISIIISFRVRHRQQQQLKWTYKHIM